MRLRRLAPLFRRGFVIGLLGMTAVVWSLLAVDTVAMVQQTAATPTPTLRPTSVVPTATPILRDRTSGPLPTTGAQPAATANADQAAAGFHPKTGRYIAAWLPDSFGSVNRQSFEANADILDEVSPFWYQPDARGNLLHGREARDASLLELAHSKGVLVIPSIHNVVTGADPVPTILRNTDIRRRHIQVIVSEVETYGYDGIDIDYESLPSNLRPQFSAFIVELGEALHAKNKLLTIAVHAKTSDYGGLGGFQDWAVIGNVVDRLRIMTYDYHWRGGGPGPVAPVYWVADVAKYAKQVVDPAKVIVGVPFYGYNWPANGTAQAQTWDAINAQILARGLKVNLRESEAGRPVQENWITYAGREVWFSTSSGLEAKIKLVQDLDLAGIAIWRLGGEDPANWGVIRDTLVEDPFESQRQLNRLLPEH